MSSTTDYTKEFIGSGYSTGGLSLPDLMIPNGSRSFINSIDQGLRTKPVPFSIESARIAQRYLLLAWESKDMLTYQFPEDPVQRLFGNELKRFAVALDGYFASRNPLLTFKFLLDGLVDLNFAAHLKKIRTAAFTRRTGAYSEEDDGLDDIVPKNFHLMEDIGDIFNYKYWFRWEEPVPEDWKFGLVDLVEPPDHVKRDWEDALRDVLPDICPVVNREEVLLTCSSSSSRLDDGSQSKVFKDKSDPRKNTFSTKPLKGWRTVVYKTPTETRDAVTLTIGHSNTIKWIEKQCAVLARNTTYSAYGKTDQEFNLDLETFYDPSCFYFNRDLTKEGIMKPRWILKSIAKVCKEKYPDIPVWDYFSVYDGFQLCVDGVWHQTKRGHGLGMANALTTIMQCATFQYLLGVLTEDLIGKIDARFYNDDATIKGGSEIAIIAYSDREADFVRALGLVPKAGKTYSSPVMILCEQYYPVHFGRKESYTKYIRRLPFAATNIVVAKAFYHLIDDPAYGGLESELLKRVIDFWGFENSSKEYMLPTFAGGWSSIKYKGVHLDFLNEVQVDQLYARGMKVGNPRLKPETFSKDEGLWEHPILAHVSIDPFSLTEEIRAMFDICQPLARIAAKYHRNTDDASCHKWYRKELIRRWNLWQTPAKPITIEDVWYRVKELYPYEDFIPPRTLFKEVPVEKVMEGGSRRPELPIQPNMLLGALGWYSGNIWINKTINYPYLVGETPLEDITPEKLSRYQESVLSLPYHSNFSYIERGYNIAGFFRERNYCNDYNVLEAWYAYHGENFPFTFPYPIERSKGGEIKNAASTYLYCMDKSGNQEIWDFWCTHGRTIPLLMMFSSLTDEDWDEIWKITETEEGQIPDLAEERFNIEIERDDEYVDFGTWRTNGRKGCPPHYEEIYNAVDNCIASYLVFKSSFEQSNDRFKGRPNEAIAYGVPEKDSIKDQLYKKVTKVEGIDYFGYYVYGIPQNNIWDVESNSDDAGGAFGDLFG